MIPKLVSSDDNCFLIHCQTTVERFGHNFRNYYLDEREGFITNIVHLRCKTEIDAILGYQNKNPSCEFYVLLQPLDENGKFHLDPTYNFVNVNEFHLENLGIKYLSPDTFDTQAECRSIYLSGNNISEIPTGVFNELEHLTTLDLSNNSIQNLNKYMLNTIKQNLISLNLPHNQINYVDKDVFQTLFKDISTLDLSHNKIADINFNHIDNIAVLNISHNNYR